MGLVVSLTTRASPFGRFFVWSRRGPTQLRFDVFSRGKTVATASVRRGLPGIRERRLTLAGTGLDGRYYAPAPGRARGIPMLVFGGSEGGLSFRALPAMLAWHGHPTLSLAYFKEPGLPHTLSRIPLEYFARALSWLRARPAAAGRRVAAIGVSRGSEAAQLLGVHYPALVGAVVAAVPSNAAGCAYPDCSAAAWTLGGRALPYTHQFNEPAPSDDPAAVIRVERIRGPLLLVCGGRDGVWLSCPFARAIAARRARFGRAAHDVEYAYPRAGHGVGELLPYVSVAPRWLYFKRPTSVPVRTCGLACSRSSPVRLGD